MRTTIFQAVVFATLVNLPLITFAEATQWRRSNATSPIRTSSRAIPNQESSGTPMDECPKELLAEMSASEAVTVKLPALPSDNTASLMKHQPAVVPKQPKVVSASYAGDTQYSGSGLPQPIIAPAQHILTSQTSDGFAQASDRLACDSIDASNTRHCLSTEDCPSSQTQSEPLMSFETGPSGFSYYFRPYQYSDVAKQQGEPLTRDRKNPYDNRFFEAIYSR